MPQGVTTVFLCHSAGGLQRRMKSPADFALEPVQDAWRQLVIGYSIVMSEHDSSSAVIKSHAKELAQLMASGWENARLWRPEELAAIFRHQMSAPMLVDLGSFDAATAARLKALSDAQSLLLKSFADLFHHPAPPLELLQLVKNFAKANIDHPESGLPGEVASALYYASIASALVHLDTRISQLPDADLRRGFRWLEEQAWLDEKTKTLLAEAKKKLSGVEEAPNP
jgi:hypothetical protein